MGTEGNSQLALSTGITDFEETRQALLSSELFSRLKDPFYLPSFAEVEALCSNAHPGSTHQLHLTHYDYQIAWQELFYPTTTVFELITKEYIEDLTQYIIARHNGQPGKKILLEIAAGDGRLSHFLRNSLNRYAPGEYTVIATDNGEWEIRRTFEVEILSHHLALAKYHPDIVICSWMPHMVDLTQEIRDQSSVEEYILVGEDDGGCCGGKWFTWGMPVTSSGIMKHNSGSKTTPLIPPFRADGFERFDIEDSFSVPQVCTSDSHDNYFHSTTVSFRRLATSGSLE
jgi:hypothetical protein